MAKTELLPGAEEPKQKIIFSSSDNAEQLLEKLECFAESILAKYSDKTNTDLEEAGYANAMLMRVRQTRRFMADAIRSQHKEDMSLNMNAAVREAMNAVLDFMWIHNSVIGDNYLRGEKILMGARDGGKKRAKTQPERTGDRDQKILNYANDLLGKHNPRRTIASIIVNNMHVLHKKYPDTSFPKTYKGIHEILKKTGFYKKTNVS